MCDNDLQRQNRIMQNALRRIASSQGLELTRVRDVAWSALVALTMTENEDGSQPDTAELESVA